MIPDVAFVADAFRRFNALIFGGSLPEPRFRLTRARTFHGKLAYKWRQTLLRRVAYDFEMRVSTVFDFPTEAWEDVVIHEMIHLHIASNGIKDSSSHGPAFRRMMTDINRRFGRHIAVSGKSSPGQTAADSRVRGHFLCIAKFSDGRLGVAPAAKSRIFELWDIARFFPDIVDYTWVGSVDPWFNRFPRVLKPKLYLASREELLPHLRGARLLLNRGNAIRAVSTRCSPDELLP